MFCTNDFTDTVIYPLISNLLVSSVPTEIQTQSSALHSKRHQMPKKAENKFFVKFVKAAVRRKIHSINWLRFIILSITFDSSAINSNSTNRFPGHARFPTPNGTTNAEPKSNFDRLFSQSIQRSGSNFLAFTKFDSSLQAIMVWHKTTD